MRVSIHGKLMEDGINNRNFAQYTSASAYDTLSEIAVKTNSDILIFWFWFWFWFWWPRSPDRRKLDHLVEEMGEGQSIFCHFADVLKIRRNPHLLRFFNNVKLLQHFFAIIAQIFCQPAIRLNRSYCPPDVVLLPASAQTIILHDLTSNCDKTHPGHPVGWDPPDSPAVKCEHFDVNIFAHTLYFLEWTVTLYRRILSMASAQNTFWFIENHDVSKDCTGPCSKCRYMIGPSGRCVEH